MRMETGYSLGGGGGDLGRQGEFTTDLGARSEGLGDALEVRRSREGLATDQQKGYREGNSKPQQRG